MPLTANFAVGISQTPVSAAPVTQVPTTTAGASPTIETAETVTQTPAFEFKLELP